jgi:hypothetical protein
MSYFEYPKPDYSMTKAEVEASCIIYIFWLGEKCQYVGVSQHGFQRPVSAGHHARRKRRELEAFDYDRLDVSVQPDHDAACELEKWIIDTLKPEYNDIYNSNRYKTKLSPYKFQSRTGIGPTVDEWWTNREKERTEKAERFRKSVSK